MENSRYEWIHRKIIENNDLSPEFILIGLKEDITKEIRRREIKCSNSCRMSWDCFSCNNRPNISYAKRLLQDLQDFARENEIDIKGYEEKKRIALLYGVNAFKDGE